MENYSRARDDRDSWCRIRWSLGRAENYRAYIYEHRTQQKNRNHAKGEALLAPVLIYQTHRKTNRIEFVGKLRINIVRKFAISHSPAE